MWRQEWFRRHQPKKGLLTMKSYMSKGGVRQFKPSFKWIERSQGENKGFCLACGKVQEGVEPDARKYECGHCRKMKVYGSEELALMGLYH
jgi:hypothetical protein